LLDEYIQLFLIIFQHSQNIINMKATNKRV